MDVILQFENLSDINNKINTNYKLFKSSLIK